MDDFEQAAAVEEPRQRGWLRRNWLWFLPSGCLGVVLIAGGGGAGVVFWASSEIKQMEPYQMAMEQVRKDPQVIERLGEPVTDVTLFFKRNKEENVKNNNGDVIIRGLKVGGRKGQADVIVQARMIDGTWGLTSVRVTFEGNKIEGNEIYSLPLDSDVGLDEAPGWAPAAPVDSSDAPPAGDMLDSPSIEMPDFPGEFQLPTPPE